MSSPRQTSRIHVSKQPHLSNRRDVGGSGANTAADGEILEQQMLLPFFRMIAEVVPGPPYELITNMEQFITCISMFEVHDLPENMISDRSPFKQLDVARRVNSIRKSTKDSSLAKRLRLLVAKWRGDAATSTEIRKSLVNGITPSHADALQMRLGSATSSPAASSTNPYSPMTNGGNERIRLDAVSPPELSEQKVSPLKIKIKANVGVNSAVTHHLNGGKLSIDRLQPQPADYYIVEQPKKRPVEATAAAAVTVQPQLLEAGDTIAVAEPAAKKQRTRPVRKRRIDLSDDEDIEDDGNDTTDSFSKLAAAVSAPSALKQKLAGMLISLPTLPESVQQSVAAQFAVFYTGQELDATLFRKQQEKRLADEAAAARTANEAIGEVILKSPYQGGGYDGYNSKDNADAVINFNADDDDEDDFSFGSGPATSTPNKVLLTANTSGYLSAEVLTAVQRPTFPDYSKRSVSPVLANAEVAVTDVDMHDDADLQGDAKFSVADFVAPGSSQTFQASTNIQTLPGTDIAIEDSKEAGVIDADSHNGFMQAVTAVDGKFLTLLHTQNVTGCNGYYDAERRWHDFTEGYVTRRSDGKRIGVAPYVVLN